MPWFTQRDAQHIQEVEAVEIRRNGVTVGWVAPDVAADLAAGRISPDEAVTIARRCPEQPAGTEARPAGKVWQQATPAGERRRWWEWRP